MFHVLRKFMGFNFFLRFVLKNFGFYSFNS